MKEKIDEYYEKINQYTSLLKRRLTVGRFEHSVNVSKEAVRLAKMYGADVRRAELAGLLHDIMKDADKTEQLECMLSCKMKLSEPELLTPKLWHAMAGSCYLATELNIEDEDILNAVRYHTTAREDMSLLERIIYLADYTSEERNYNGVEMMREAVDKGLDIAMEEALTFSLCDLAGRGRYIHPDTLGAYNEIIIKKITGGQN